jgi:hypothetical protein
MTAKPKISGDGHTITVRVPIAIRTRGGGKVILAPSGIARPGGNATGAKPADPPVVQATRFARVINRPSARGVWHRNPGNAARPRRRGDRVEIASR